MTTADLPALNASLNALSFCFLVGGFLAIRNQRINLHRGLMGAAFLVSMAFLVSYLIYHYHQPSTPFQGTGIIRVVYFVILISHIILAAVNLPMVLLAVYRGVRDQREAHRRIVKWTLPLWMYVSLTGVLVYLMLYQMNFGPAR